MLSPANPRLPIWIALCFAMGCAWAQSVILDPSFPAGTGPDDYVRALAIDAQGRLLVGGSFSNLNGVAQAKFARLKSDGSLDSAFAPVVDKDPSGIFPLADGRIVITGFFTNVGGSLRPGVARVNADGSVDAGFSPPTTYKPAYPWSQLRLSGVPAPDGKVYVTGNFTNLAGFPRNHFARLLSDGSVDPTFDSPFAPTNMPSVLLVQPDGKPLVAGTFLWSAGQPLPNLVRLNPDGSLDASFNVQLPATNGCGSAVVQADGSILALIGNTRGVGITVVPRQLLRFHGDGSLDSGFNVAFAFADFDLASAGISAVAECPDYTLLVAGRFLRVNGTPRAWLAHLQPDGELDQCFDPPVSDRGNAFKIVAAPDGTVVMAGVFPAIRGASLAYLVRLLPFSSCAPGVIEFTVAAVATANDAPQAVVPAVRRGGADGAQAVEFATVAGTATDGLDYDAVSGTLHFAPGERSHFISIPLHRTAIPAGGKNLTVMLRNPGGGANLGVQTNAVVTLTSARVGAAGAPDTNYVVRLDAAVSGILPLPGGGALIAGAFNNVNTQTCPNLVLLLPNGARDLGFVRTQKLDGGVVALALQTDGRFLVAGTFGTVDGVWRPGLARFNLDGSTDASFNPFAAWPSNGPGMRPQVQAVTVLTDGSIVCSASVPAGLFQSPVLLKFSPGGELDRAFTNQIAGWVTAGQLTALPNGDFLAGGSNLGGPAVRLHPDGLMDLTFNPAADYPGAGPVQQLGVMPDQRVVVGGYPAFSSSLAAQPPIWRLNPEGSLDASFALANGPPEIGQVYGADALAVAPDGRVLVAGEVSAPSAPPVALFRLMPDGSFDPSFDQGAGVQPIKPYNYVGVQALASLPTGGWLLGGAFSGYDGFNQPYLVKILPESLARPPQFQFTITNVTVFETNGSLTLEILRRGDASQAASVTVQTQDGTATAGQDFVGLNTTVSFAPGQWRQSVSVGIINDRVVEGGESFTVRLSQPTAGFSLGQPATVSASVVNDHVGIEFISDQYSGNEQDGFAMAAVRWTWTGLPSAGVGVQVNFVPEVGSGADLLSGSVWVPRDDVRGSMGTNWFRIGLAVHNQHQPTRQFRLELVPNDRAIPGPRTNATLLVNDQNFATAPARGVEGVVEAIANSPGGGVYLAGDFTGVHGVKRVRVARLLPNGEVDPAFDPGSGPDGDVTALAIQADGKALIGGAFTSVSGWPLSGLARLNTDGTVDASFFPGAGPVFTNGVPFVLALLPRLDGSILVGGLFAQLAGVDNPYLARLTSNGSLDAGFHSPFSLPNTASHQWTRLLAVNALVPLPDGRVLADESGLVMRLAPAGQIDPTFRQVPAITWDDATSSLALDLSGRVLVGGTGTSTNTFAPSGDMTNWVAIRRFSTNGSLDSTFQVQGVPSINYTWSNIRQILVDSAGRILFAAAIYVPVGKATGMLNQAMVGRLLPNGHWDEGFALLTCGIPLRQEPGPFGLNDLSSPAGGIVQFPFGTSTFQRPWPTVFLAQQPDGVLVLAGAFDSVNGEPRHRLARVDSSGALRGRLDLGLAAGNPLRLLVPPEVEIPYVLETATDLAHWSPWLTNTAPWSAVDQPVPAADHTRFFRAHNQP